MSRRVAFTTLSPEAAAEVAQPMTTPAPSDALPELTGARHLQNMISNWDHLASGGTADSVPHQRKRATPSRPKKAKKAKKTKKGKNAYQKRLLAAALSPIDKPKGKNAYQRRLLKAATSASKVARSAHSRTSVGIPLTNRTTLRSLIWKMPWTRQPLSTLLRMEGWLNPRATLQSIVHRIPQAKAPLAKNRVKGVKN